MPFEIARLNEDGVIIAVEQCAKDDYQTNPTARTVQLDANHDMRNRIGNYKWNYLRGAFEPVTQEPINTGEVDTSELVEGLVETIEDMSAYLSNNATPRRTLGGERSQSQQFELPRRMQRVLKDYRRARPRKNVGSSE